MWRDNMRAANKQIFIANDRAAPIHRCSHPARHNVADTVNSAVGQNLIQAISRNGQIPSFSMQLESYGTAKLHQYASAHYLTSNFRKR